MEMTSPKRIETKYALGALVEESPQLATGNRKADVLKFAQKFMDALTGYEIAFATSAGRRTICA